MPESFQSGALTEAVYYILLALYEPMHGYGIMKLVKKISNERVNLGPGTLYGAINVLLEKGWIQVLGTVGDSRKKEYRITAAGMRVVGDEILRLQELIDNGRMITKGER